MKPISKTNKNLINNRESTPVPSKIYQVAPTPNYSFLLYFFEIYRLQPVDGIGIPMVEFSADFSNFLCPNMTLYTPKPPPKISKEIENNKYILIIKPTQSLIPVKRYLFAEDKTSRREINALRLGL